MSLVILAAEGPRGVVVSDGRMLERQPDESMRRCRDDYPKFRTHGSCFVIAATGSAQLAEHLHQQAGAYLTDSPGATFTDLWRFLQAGLPDWDRRERAAFAGMVRDEAMEVGVAVALLGYDTAVRRARIITFSDDDGYAALELGGARPMMAMGATDPRAALAAAEETPWSALRATFAGIIGDAALANDAEIGGHIYAHEFGPPPDVSPDFAALAEANGWTLMEPMVCSDTSDDGEGKLTLRFGSTPVTPRSLTGKTFTTNGSATQPVDQTQTYLKILNGVQNSTASALTTFVGYAPFIVADGVTITALESVTSRLGLGGLARITFSKVSSAGVSTTLATHTNSTFLGAGETITTSGLTELVDNTTYSYTVLVELNADPALVPPLAWSSFWRYRITYSSPSLSKAL